MRALFTTWLAVLCLLAPALAQAQQAPVPRQTALLVDAAGALEQGAAAALQQRLQAIQASGRAQVAVLVTPSTQGEPLAAYSLRVAQSWKLGHAGHDDGLLVVVVPADGAARIEVGYGLEGAIPDLRASQWVAGLLPTLKNQQLAAGLGRLLDQVEAALPAQAAAPTALNILDQHPEWKLPFVLAIFSPFALFPLFLGRGPGLVSAPLFAGFLGGAAWMLWNSVHAAVAVACVAFVLPLLWGLNHSRSEGLPRWLGVAKGIGNAAAVLIFFAVVTVFVGAGLSGNVEEVWAAPLFAGMLAIGLAVFLFPGKPADVLMVVLRSFGHFVFVLLIAYLGLQGFVPHPAKLAFSVAGAFTACVAMALYLDSRESTRAAGGEPGTRWSLWLVALALLVALPFGLMLMVHAVLGEDFHTRLAQAAAGGGSLAGVLWWAARRGLFAALVIGLGGRFGGGGAEGRG
ncbi:MAG: TPM domain-containing protein [Burkholderiales bacterium]|nr:TPM domain-containing protein [Burkholderiales bacterium]